MRGPAETLYRAGVTDLVSVTRPGVELSPRSALSPAALGKAPGIRYPDGTWGGYDWRQRPSLEDVRRWDEWGANVGVQGRSFPAIDVDLDDQHLADQVRAALEGILPPGPLRVRGDSPRALLPFTLEGGEHVFRRQLLLDGAVAVELLGDGQQWVAVGEHPSGEGYRLEGLRDVRPLFPPVTAQLLHTALDLAREALEAWGCVVEETRSTGVTERGWVDQESLRAPLERVRAAVEAIPNSDEAFPTREDYIRVGYAIRAATGGSDSLEGFDIWWDWCQRWDGGVNELEEARRDWQKMRPPYEIGADWLFEQARRFGWSDADAVFRAVEGPSNDEDPSEGSGYLQYSDGALASRLVAEWGSEMLYCETRGGWHVWDGARWTLDDVDMVRGVYTADVLQRAAGEARERIPQASKAERVAHRLSSASAHSAVLSLAQASPVIAVPADVFDSDPWALNTPSGVWDLRSFELGPHRKGSYHTRVTREDVDETRDTPLWDRFLAEATGGDDELVDYLRRVAGYCLTGSTEEHALFFLYGPGGNGKSVFVNALLWALGPGYGRVAPMTSFTRGRYDQHPTDLAGLAGARLVTAQETQEGRSWDEARVKALTAGEPITARFMRRDFFTYVPGFKLLLAGNHRPRIDNLDEAWKRRVRLIPFLQQPREVDIELGDKLRGEAAGILGWMMRGCREWQAGGLGTAQVVERETREYFESEDPYGQWVDECLVVGETVRGSFTLTEELWDSWRQWCFRRGTEHRSQKALVMVLKDRFGLERGQDPQSRRMGFLGVEVRPAGRTGRDVEIFLES